LREEALRFFRTLDSLPAPVPGGREGKEMIAAQALQFTFWKATPAGQWVLAAIIAALFALAIWHFLKNRE